MTQHRPHHAGAATSSRRHLLISGTGRAGTSFLVRYLTALGLDTHLARRGAAAGWSEDAHAGLEDLPSGADPNSLPYVIKSPWLAFHPESLGPDVTLDAIIVPVRGLAEAAASRVLNERRAMLKAQPWMQAQGQAWDVWAHVPGGVVYSLDATDQARLLAVAFHTIVHHALSHDIPLVLLEFPRLAQDGDYLFARLAPVLGRGVTRDRAIEAHRRLADPAKLRTEGELAQARSDCADKARGLIGADLAGVAARREVDATMARLEAAEARAAAAEARLGRIESHPAWRASAPIRRVARWVRDRALS